MLMYLDTISHDISKFAKAILTGCAYAGTGNVLTVQKLLHVCAEHPQAEVRPTRACVCARVCVNRHVAVNVSPAILLPFCGARDPRVH